MKNIRSILNPKSIAVVGATSRPGSVGRAVFCNILQNGYHGVLYPVNPKASHIHSVKAYPRLTDIPDEVDMAVIVVPPEHVPGVMEEAAAKGVRGVIVITAGFKEVGGAGVEQENRLKEIVRRTGLRMVGPNCLGVINTDDDVMMNASFARLMPKPGNIAFISQSGALCTSVLDFAAGRNVGFSKFISFGNKADVNEVDLLRYLKEDPQTQVILMYLEDISNGREFIDEAREITWEAKKPMLAIKSGRSAEGAKAAASHTGSLAGSDLAYDAIFFQSGIQRVEGVNELFDYAIAYANQPVPKSKKIAIITNAGGPGIMATDAAIRSGLSLAVFSQETEAKLRECLPPTANIHNPVDVIGDANHERYENAIRQVLQDPEVAGAIIMLTPTALTDILETAQVVPPAQEVGKPILCSFMGVLDVSEGVKYLESHGVPNYPFPEYAIKAMAAMVRYGELLALPRREVRRMAADRRAAEQIIAAALAEQTEHMMTEHEANEILQAYGFPLLKSRLLTDPGQVETAAREVGFPVAMKIISPDIVHKFDAGGVVLRIASADQARAAYDQILQNARKYKPGAEIKGVLMERMAEGGVEVILGSTRDPKFGPICMFGLGGTFVEVMKDVVFRVAPMWEISAEIMIDSIKAHKLLLASRGQPGSDIPAIKDCILRLSQMVSDLPQIAELDINPLIVYPEGQGCVVADSRILLRREDQTAAK